MPATDAQRRAVVLESPPSTDLPIGTIERGLDANLAPSDSRPSPGAKSLPTGAQIAATLAPTLERIAQQPPKHSWSTPRQEMGPINTPGMPAANDLMPAQSNTPRQGMITSDQSFLSILQMLTQMSATEIAAMSRRDNPRGKAKPSRTGNPNASPTDSAEAFTDDTDDPLACSAASNWDSIPVTLAPLSDPLAPVHLARAAVTHDMSGCYSFRWFGPRPSPDSLA